MKVGHNVNWVRILAEGFAIVVSILLAFAIDAWWDERQQRYEEHEILLGLDAEFNDLKSRLDRWAKFNQDGATEIEQLLNAPIESLDKEFIERVIEYSWIVNVLDQGGPLDALLASGRLERIENHEIRMRLGKWPDWLEDIHSNDLSIRHWAWDKGIAYLNRHGYPRHMCHDRLLFCTQPGPVPPEYLQMIEDAEFRSMLRTRRLGMLLIAKDHSDASQEAGAILGLIHGRMSDLETMLGLE